ncbi:uncharacterized protein [Palaemon carinicauda]|uniref:uncharacterized protein isoform X2 n=1 Tax=Palaemon carinicauda TaxID=392227 RepID=UPI0035B5778C
MTSHSTSISLHSEENSKPRRLKVVPWTPDAVHCLNRKVKLYPILWDRNHPHYYSVGRKKAVWEKIARELASKFPRLRKRRRTVDYEPKWRYFQSCSFMLSPQSSDSSVISQPMNQQTIQDHLESLEADQSCEKVNKWIMDISNLAKTKLLGKEIQPRVDAGNCVEEAIPEMEVEGQFTDQGQPVISPCEENTRPKMDQDHFDERLIAFILDEMLPISVVDNQNLKDMFTGVYPTLNLIPGQSLGLRIIKRSRSIQNRIKEDLAKQAHICMTVDVWSSKGMCYVRVTVHWIDGETFERRSASLALKRFKDIKDDQVSQIMDDILKQYSIRVIKITAIMKGCRCNFVDVFRDYGIQSLGRSETPGDVYDSTDTSDEDMLSSSRIETRVEKLLPFNMRCMSQVLSMICTKDLNSVFNGSLGKLHRNALSKCSSVWKKMRNPNLAKISESIFKCSPILPNCTSWVSLHNSIQVLLRHRIKLGNVMQAFNLPQFEGQELDYLGEYVAVLEPVANGLKRWQNDKNCFYGSLLPTLLAIEKKLRALLPSKLQYCQPVLARVMEAFKLHFDHFLQLDTSINGAIVACASNPQFKLRWLTIKEETNTSVNRKRVQELLITAIKIEKSSLTEHQQQKLNSDNSSDEFFDFGKDLAPAAKNDMAEVEVLNYLYDSSHALTSLVQYPSIKGVFLKYNTPIPSSAPIEKLFDFPGPLDVPTLSNKMFETYVMLKGNLSYRE